MPTILAHTIAAPGHLFPFAAVLAELQRRKRDVTLCVSAPQVPAERIGEIPVRWVPCDAYEPFPSTGQRREMQRVWLTNVARSGDAAAAATARLIAEERPDFVLVDPSLWGSMVVAEASKIPWATIAHNPLAIRGRGLDVRGPGLRPASGAVGRFRDRVVDIGLRASMLRPLQMLNGVRATHGLPPLMDFRDLYLTPPLTIAATAEPFEYPRTDWPPSLLFVGPLVWDDEVANPESCDDIAEQPLVLLTGSTVPEHKTSPKWIRVAFDALADEPLRVIATLPIDDVPARVPPNVFATGFLSHRYVLPRAQCVICHGGHGITTKALSLGVPVLAIPLGLDRFEVARRVEMANAGAMLLQRQLTPKRFRVALRRAMACKAGAERVAAAFRRAGGAAVAARAVERLLEAHRVRATQPAV